MWYLIILLAVLGAPFAYRFTLKWILAPILIHRRQTLALRLNHEFVTPEHITPELQHMLQSILPQFQAEGFTVAANLHHPSAMPGTRSLQVLLINRATNDIGLIMAVWAKTNRSLVFNVRSEFGDDTSVVTAFNRGIGFYPKDPAVDVMVCSWVQDAQTLCELHRRRLDRLGKAHLPRTVFAPGEELQYVEREWQRGCERFVRVGYHYADHAAGVLRYTWKGAFLGAWKLTQPIKRWRMAARDRRARREWRSLGMDQWTPPASRPHTAPSPAEPAAAFISAADAAPTDLSYESTLPEDEIRQEFIGDTLVVRMGRMTIGRFLLRRWLSMLAICFWCAMLGLNLYFYWRLQMLAVRSRLPIPKSIVGLPIIVMLILAIVDIRKLIVGALSLRGTVVITASPRGITFKNAPDATHSGAIVREDLAGLAVVGSATKLLGSPLKTLYAHLENDRNQVLLAGSDAQALEDVRTNLLRTMGIEGPLPPPAAMPN